MEDDELYLENLRVLVEQAKIEVDFEDDGLTADVLERQLRVNELKEEYGFIDDNEVIYTDKKYRRFVQ